MLFRSQSITVSPLSTTVYNVTGFNGICSSSASFTQNVQPAFTPSITATSPSICAGFSVGLFALGSPSTYTWLPNNSISNPLIDSPLATTVYTVITNNSGCFSSATISIVVVPLPSVGLTANPQVICAGNTTTLTASGALTYSWIPSLVGGNTFTDNPIATDRKSVV